MLQLGLPEKLRQQAARVGHYEYFEMYSSVCVRSIQDWLTRPKNIIQLPGNTWQYGILHALRFSVRGNASVCMLGHRSIYKEGVCPEANCCAVLWRGSVMNVTSTSEPHCLAGCGEVERKYGS